MSAPTPDQTAPAVESWRVLTRRPRQKRLCLNQCCWKAWEAIGYGRKTPTVFPAFRLLPRELRNLVYELSLGPARTIGLLQEIYHSIECDPTHRSRIYSHRSDADSFRRTSREAYDEITRLMFGHFNFDLSCYCGVRTLLSGRDLNPFRYLKTITFHYSGSAEDAGLLRRLALCEQLRGITLLIPHVNGQHAVEQATAIRGCPACDFQQFAYYAVREECFLDALMVAPALLALTYLRGLDSFRIRYCPCQRTNKHFEALEDKMAVSVKRPAAGEELLLPRWVAWSITGRRQKVEYRQFMAWQLKQFLRYPDLDPRDYEAKFHVWSKWNRFARWILLRYAYITYRPAQVVK